MKLAFVHGWSVTHKNTYGGLPAALEAKAAAHGLSIETVDIFLGRYISFHNEVRMDDLERAVDRALRDALPDGNGGIAEFSCITHSTGGPVMRSWIDRYYGAEKLGQCPLRHLVMLAPANHGSALACIGKARVGRLKAFLTRTEPGEQILEWLELGSSGQRTLNRAWLDYRLDDQNLRFFPVVLTGETIDKALYDYVNAYTGEAGSDGVVRAAAANLNHSWIILRQTDEQIRSRRGGVSTRLVIEGQPRTSARTPFGIIPGASHSGGKIGIMGSVKPENADEKPVVKAILDALSIRTRAEWLQFGAGCAERTNAIQVGRPSPSRYFQVVFNVRDDQDQPISDFDVILLGGAQYDPEALPRGFFVDKQFNSTNRHTITFYLDFDRMMSVPKGKFGFRIVARPQSGFASYGPAEFQSENETVDRFVDPNATVYIDVRLRRLVDRETARFALPGAENDNFKGARPSGETVP